MDVSVTVSIVLRTRTPEHPTLTVLGVTPCAECPLAVTEAYIFDHATQAWQPHSRGGYYITHRPTGYQLGSVRFDTEAEALGVIERLDWRFPAWPVATGEANDPAMLACRAKWRAAVPSWRE